MSSKPGFQSAHQKPKEAKKVLDPKGGFQSPSKKTALILSELTPKVEELDCTSTEEEEEEETSPELDEGEFRDVVCSFATNYGIETAKHLFAVELGRLQHQKKQKTKK